MTASYLLLVSVAIRETSRLQNHDGSSSEFPVMFHLLCISMDIRHHPIHQTPHINLCLGIFQPERFQNSVPWIAHLSGPSSHWVVCNTEHSIGAQRTNSKSLETPICQRKMYPCSIKDSVPLLLFAALSDLYIQLMMSHSVWWVWCVFSVGRYDHKCY